MKTTRGENGTNKWCKINLRQPDYCALCSQYARGKRHEGKKKLQIATSTSAGLRL